MIALPDPARRLEDCPLVIFIAYSIGPHADADGYAEWLKRVDMPFFNAIPETRHYANWRLTEILVGPAPVWNWFDFQGLASEADLERVWFDPNLDAFRVEWIRLWGYGSPNPPPVLRHAYLTRPSGLRRAAAGARTLTLSGGTGDVPQDGSADIVFRIDGILHKHFAGRDESRPWLTPAADFNPLGLDWLAVGWGAPEPLPTAVFAARSMLVAAPDRD